jgi:hypothetical protein
MPKTALPDLTIHPPRSLHRRAPASIEQRERMNQYQSEAARDREDIATWFDVLDLDDFASFGGPA